MASYDSNFPPRHPPQHDNPTTSSSTGIGPNSQKLRQQGTNSLDKFCGRAAEPGKVLTKEERDKRRQSEQARIDSVTEIPTAKPQRAQQPNWYSFGYVSKSVGDSFQVNLAPEAAAHAVQNTDWKHGALNIRTIIVGLIMFLLVFGPLWTLVDYLLQASRVSAQCNATTVFFPVTYTYTTSVMVPPTTCLSSSADSPLDTSSAVSPMLTLTKTSTAYETSTLTVTATATLSDPSSSPSTLPYMFTGDSSTTAWLNGNSPSSGASLVTATTTVPIYPSDSLSPGSTITVHSTLTNLITVSPPVFSSTVFSLSGPDSTSTTHITRTKTIQSMTTITRSSFSGVGTSGWNLTSSTEPAMVQGSASAISSAMPTTATVTYYWATGDQTYSTSTTTLTTTLYTPMPSATTVTLGGTTITQSVSQVSRTNSGPGVSFTGTGSQPSLQSTTVSLAASSGFPQSSLGSSRVSSPSLPGTSGPEHTSLSTAASFPANSSSSSGLSPSFASSSGTLATVSFAASSLSTNSAGGSHPSYTNSATPIASANSTVPASTGGSIFTSSPVVPATLQSASGSSLANPVGISHSPTSGNPSIASSSAARNATSLPANGYGDPSLSAVPATTVSPSPSSGQLSSASPSTEALSSLGSSFANGPGSTVSFSPLSSATPSTQALSSLGSSFAQGSASASSRNTSSTAVPTRKATSTPSTSTSTNTSTRSASSSTTPSASPTPSVCGEHGDFTLDFDDLPSFTPSNANQTDVTQAPPIFSPYHHLTFSDGYVHAPPPNAPYQTHSGKQMAVFLGNASSNASTEDSAMSAHSSSGRIQPGEISDGAYDSSSAYWFNPRTAWLGCDNAGPAPCTFRVTGWTWDSTTGQEIPAYNTQYNLPPCPSLENCQLSQVSFPPSFQGLTGLQIQSYVGNEQRMFFMDDLAMSWYNNTCAAGLQRQGGPGSGPGHSGAGAGRPRSVRRFIT